MKREMFLRPNRMTHRFGEAEASADPLGTNTFDYKGPLPGASRRSRPLNLSTDGEYRSTPTMSPVEKFRGGCAVLSGPAPDYADALAYPIPPSSKKRVGHLKTDK